MVLISQKDYPEADQPETGAGTLSAQLGSAFKFLDEGEIDMRILGVLMDPKDVPRGMRSLVFLATYAELFEDEAVASLVKNFLHLTVAVRGRGRRDIIRMESVARGGQVDVESEIQRPGWLERNVLNRDWEQKEKEKLGI